MGHLDALTLKVFSIGDGSGPRSVVREHWWTTSLQGVLRAAVKAASDSFLKARREGRTDVARPPRTREEAVFNHSDQSITLTPYDETSKAWYEVIKIQKLQFNIQINKNGTNFKILILCLCVKLE